MPTDEQVGLSTVFHLADEIVSGETFHPSGGLKFDRSVTEGELLLPPGKEELTHAIIVRGVTADVEVLAIGDDIEGALDSTLRKSGVDVVVSSPFARLPMKALAAERGESWDRVLSDTDFAALVNGQLTHHFRVAQRAALVPRCQIVLLTPGTSLASSREEFALALFVKNSLHAFTVTLGVESERLPSVPAVNQVQLTRRARTEEPANDKELEEEMVRLVYAVLQCSVPAPSPSDSRYLARIFRGNAVTV